MAATSSDEAARLAAVRRYDILDTPPDGAFDRISALAARICQVPISTITIVDEDRIWFKSAHGVDVVEIGRDPGLCASAIMQDVPYVVTNAVEDPRALDNPLVRGDLGLRFYVGVPLVTSDGHRLGTLNIIDAEPREPTAAELQTLTDLAAVVMDELELRLAARRTIELEAAREAAEFRASLLAGISHDMRTPIAVLNGIASLEANDGANDEEIRLMMRRHVRQLDWMVNRYLDFTRLESGQAPRCTPEETDAASLVQGAASVFATDAQIEVQIEDGLPVLLADPNRTREILLELLHNAIRFGPPDAPVTLLARDRGDGTVGVTVSDRGPGIPAQEHDRLFDRLARGENSTGTGIGLHVARALAQSQGGRIDVDSTPGDGSHFTLILPVMTE